MVKSGLIIGAITLVLILGFAFVISPFCAPCLALALGIVAGYLAGVFDKPVNSGESVRKGAVAGAIAGALGFVGGLIGGVINGAVTNPSAANSIIRSFGISNIVVGRSEIWATQLGGAFCLGLFDILWMAIFGLAGGALWYQISGKNQSGTVLPPQQPITPSM